MVLDTKLDVTFDPKNVQNKVNKTARLIRKFQNTSPRTSSMTIVKSFIKPHLYCGKMLNERAYNTSFHRNVESVQYNAAL